MLSSTVGTNSRACLFFSLPASPRLSTRLSPMQSLTPPFSSSSLPQTTNVLLCERAKNEETSSIPSIIELANEHGIQTRGYLLHKNSSRILKPNHSIRWIQVTACGTDNDFVFPRTLAQSQTRFINTILSLRIAIHLSNLSVERDTKRREGKARRGEVEFQNSVNVTWLSEDLSRGSGRGRRGGGLWLGGRGGVETRERAGRSRPIKWAASRYLSWPAMRLPRTSL